MHADKNMTEAETVSHLESVELSMCGRLAEQLSFVFFDLWTAALNRLGISRIGGRLVGFLKHIRGADNLALGTKVLRASE
jgi:hypothetical protein